ncbi:MAG TPA: His/Gly/Thr/Pro-type tRNA ligase C-terminal domain-containing protein, partial [Planctomycetota bacterium]|nr:His/Gly/Thr/Pro-type tRNA ligase C-terminal domain-containing protein [Planctomycetota bacterium]
VECEAVKQALAPAHRVHVDAREGQSPGWKFNFWELKGAPVRIEVGPKDLEKGQLCVARRHDASIAPGEKSRKEFLPRDAALRKVPEILAAMQDELFQRAKTLRASKSRAIDDPAAFERFFAEGGGFASVHWCGDGDCEKKTSANHKSSIRNIPLDGREEAGKCITCGRPSSQRVLMAMAY